MFLAESPWPHPRSLFERPQHKLTLDRLTRLSRKGKMPRKPAILVLLSLAISSSVAAQSVPSAWFGQPLRSCAYDIRAEPCRAHFDVLPALLTPVDTTFTPRQTPQIWVLVDSAGRAVESILHLSAQYEVDQKALAQAKQLRFQPATRDGTPVAAWVVIALNVGRVAETCNDMAVALSAWKSQFGDSVQLDRLALGWQYAYRGMNEYGFGEADLDVFIYPASAWPSSEEQASDFASTESRRYRAVRVHGPRAYVVRPERGSEIPRVLRGHQVRIDLRLDDGTRLESLWIVVGDGNRFIKVRASYPMAGSYREDAARFARDVLSSIRDRPMHCAT
jgi:hypothetical protein